MERIGEALQFLHHFRGHKVHKMQHKITKEMLKIYSSISHSNAPQKKNSLVPPPPGFSPHSTILIKDLDHNSRCNCWRTESQIWSLSITIFRSKHKRCWEDQFNDDVTVTRSSHITLQQQSVTQETTEEGCWHTAPPVSSSNVDDQRLPQLWGEKTCLFLRIQ